MKRFLAFFLATLILVSGGGVFMSVHRCLSSSHSDVSFSGSKSCCGDKQSDSECAGLKSKCCSIATYYSKIHVVSFVDQKAFAIADVVIPVIRPVVFSFSFLNLQFPTFHAPPPVEYPVIAFHQLLI